jgi:hypothetical protein
MSATVPGDGRWYVECEECGDYTPEDDGDLCWRCRGDDGPPIDEGRCRRCGDSLPDEREGGLCWRCAGDEPGDWEL